MKSVKYSLGLVLGVAPLLVLNEKYKERVTAERVN